MTNSKRTAPPVEQFISKFCQWARKEGLPTASHARLPAALRHAVHDELPQRDNEAILVARGLAGVTGLRSTWLSKHLALLPGEDGYLLVAVAMPSWRQGWGSISKDDHIVEAVSDFFHFASQYVARSRMTSVLAALAITYRRAGGFLGGDSMLQCLLLPDESFEIQAVAALSQLEFSRQSRNPTRPHGSTEQRSAEDIAGWMRLHLDRKCIKSTRARMFRDAAKATFPGGREGKRGCR